MANGATSVFCDLLALAGSSTAITPWQQWLILHFCDSERVSTGISGFDLAELPWTREWPAAKDFFLGVVDLAAARYGWDRLHYDPHAVDEHLRAYRRMLLAFTPSAAAGSAIGDWTVPPQPYEVDLCTRHTVFRGEYGCRLCDVSVQPVDAPTVCELVSTRDVQGRLVHREVRQIPETVRALLDSGSTDVRVDDHLRDRVETLLGVPLDPLLDHVLRIAVA